VNLHDLGFCLDELLDEAPFVYIIGIFVSCLNTIGGAKCNFYLHLNPCQLFYQLMTNLVYMSKVAQLLGT
jgi:hypothetical protein